MIELNAFSNQIAGKVQLSSSKSISNRLLILSAMAKNNLKLSNLSDADDTKLLDQILSKPNLDSTIDCHHAGTTFRFLTAYLSTKEGLFKLYGSERMHQRPIAPLVDAINQIGGEIEYLEKKGFPPLLIRGKQITGGEISITGDVSSQFISALLLVAPTIKNGLTLEITSKVISKPYIDMTLGLMSEFGIEYSWENNVIKVEQQNYIAKNIKVENDWSAASFWYSFLALSKSGEVKIPNLYADSLQGDSVLSSIYLKLGIKTEFNEDSIVLYKTKNIAKELELDLSNHPDLALPIIVTCCGLGIKAHLKGLESLKIKESNRLECIKKELSKFNINCEIDSTSIKIKENQNIVQPISVIECHNDHRIVMSIAPLCMKVDSIKFDDKEVVNKSYPKFWEDIQNVGIDFR